VSLTVQQVLSRFPDWQITDISGGWVTMRVNFMPKNSGLSTVRCGQTLEELAGNLHAEIRQQKSRKPAVGRSFDGNPTRSAGPLGPSTGSGAAAQLHSSERVSEEAFRQGVSNQRDKDIEPIQRSNKNLCFTMRNSAQATLR
jgi:hypothetical protein